MNKIYDILFICILTFWNTLRSYSFQFENKLVSSFLSVLLHGYYRLPVKRHPDKSPPTISPLGLLKRVLQKMPLTLTCSD